MLRISQLEKSYPNGRRALAGLDLCVATGEILAVLGGSGCGKSTLLRLIGGLDQATSGTIALDGTPVTAPRDEIGMVFQEPCLMPWLRIKENVAFGIRHLPRTERDQRSRETLDRVGLAGHEQHWPRELSGGQAQRVALARALVARPRVLLLDEPFSALDPLLRADLQDHLLDLWADDRPMMILVTHDIEEALVLADRIVVMRSDPGRIQVSVTPAMPRPRDRNSSSFQQWKSELLRHMGPADHALPGAAADSLKLAIFR
jgi:sulfonate transport system ATP-binding protein